MYKRQGNGCQSIAHDVQLVHSTPFGNQRRGEYQSDDQRNIDCPREHAKQDVYKRQSIDCTGVEDALDVTIAQRAELDYLIYNDPLGYADPKEYLKKVAGSHGLED